MKRLILIHFVLVALCLSSQAQEFRAFFEEKSLRMDYLFTGDATRQEISLDKLSSWEGWAGRKHRLSELPLEGNGQVEVSDEATGQIIYRTSFSSLFSEWLSTDEAQTTRKSLPQATCTRQSQPAQLTSSGDECHEPSGRSQRHSDSHYGPTYHAP